MDITDKLYTEWAWRTKTGVPDIKNPEDKAILDKLIFELTNTDGEISKGEIISAINKGTFTAEQLQLILNGISSVAYKEDILEYLKTKGRAVTSIAKYVYNELVDFGDVQNFHSLLTGENMPTYDKLGNSGNLFKLFADKFSLEFLRYLMDKKPAISNIATGKGEIFLGVLVRDVTTDSPNGDINGGGKDIEIKNKGARPAGQKFAFGKNVDKVMIKLIVDKINQKLDTPIEGNFRARPFHRINLILDKIKEQNLDLIDDVLEIADEAISRIYVGIDLTGLSIKNYKKGNSIDADSFELAFCKRIVRAYADEEGFEEVLFLDDTTGNFVKIPNSSLDNLLGKQIRIKMKDGLPEWSYVF